MGLAPSRELAMQTHVKLSIGLFCAFGMSLSACGKKEEKAEATPAETKPATEAAASPTPTPAPAPAAKPVETAPVAATETAPIKLDLTSKEMGKEFETSLGEEKIVAFEKEFAAKELCTESTLLNPDTVEVFETGTPDQLVVLCPGGLDGETNVVTLFEKGKEPRSESVSPLDSSHRIEDDKLASTVEKFQESE